MQLLLDHVLPNIVLLSGELSGEDITNQKQQDKWEQITMALNTLGLSPARHWTKVLKAWQDLKSCALNKLTFNHNLMGNSASKEKTLTKWEKCVMDYLAKADSSLISGMAAGLKQALHFCQNKKKLSNYTRMPLMTHLICLVCLRAKAMKKLSQWILTFCTMNWNQKMANNHHRKFWRTLAIILTDAHQTMLTRKLKVHKKQLQHNQQCRQCLQMLQPHSICAQLLLKDVHWMRHT